MLIIRNFRVSGSTRTKCNLTDLLKKTGFIRGLRLYAQAQNLFTFTKFSGLDPEGTSNLYAAQYPMSRQFTFGLDLMF